jgi:pimeloyl-ACP methyl ester carboxylesterase
MKLSHPARILRWLIVLAVVAALGLYVVLPAGFGVAATLPARTAVGPPPDGFEEVALQTGDGVTLAGWYAPPANGAAIILLHGAGGSREDVRPYAAMLARRGYGVLALDQRGHGQSGGRTNKFAWQGTPDVGAGVKYLQARPEVARIGGLGLSMGAEALLGAASEYPALRAVVADGATRRSLDELLALPSERPLVRNFTARVLFAAVQVLSGQPPPKPLLDSMVEAQSTRFLLIAGGANALEVEFNQLFAATLGARGDLWVAPGASHVGAFGMYGDEYEQRVIDFFDETLQSR